ncbi:MAG: alpha/beta-hydrolase family protein [Pseudotabrizicola sp.]|uniref:alpha/beta hydrolase n=1 Tax=Pseudotabrizicola sp. TaxID=2939647 RepID=UPI002730D5D6|nr:alpha/beta-hydrolase family protein [Pseudotabrizicola sp.]MDP2081268.1 alpha/beta-hydrolase family protein [Pseudotabrizicola sp.]MDZ7576113.1 alpha/beta-hydrolase family protein [Pseudotabrizicola sp.]
MAFQDGHVSIQSNLPAPVLWRRLSAGGIVLGAICFCFALTPSLVPREPLVQGALGGAVFGVGYGIWFLMGLLANWLEVRLLSGRSARLIAITALGVTTVATAICLWLSTDWQNSIRSAWGLPAVDTWAPFTVLALSAAVFLVLLVFGRMFWLISTRWSHKSKSFLAPKLANLLGLLAALAIFSMLINGVLLRASLRLIDSASRAADAIIPPDMEIPAGYLKTGSAASLVAWEDLGRWGRNYVTSGPDGAAIAAFWGAPAPDPIRVYVGLNAAYGPAARAALAFEELRRVGGFDRKVLVIAMPTGSGWLDPGAMNSLEFIARGDVATVAVQYSYLASPVSVVVDPRHGLAEAQAMFDLVYAHWTALPRDARPRLYLHGLSLGAFLSQETVPLLDVLGDPIQGAMWAGSPFLSDFWNMVVNRRQPDSPAWKPRFGNGSLIRTGNQGARFDAFQTDWGDMRLVFLQYGSDPIVFFDWSLAWRRPDWLTGIRAPDVSPKMQWVPVVTLLQVGMDMAVALGDPGFGHDYIARHYIPAWAAALAPDGWDDQTEARLIAHLDGLRAR